MKLGCCPTNVLSLRDNCGGDIRWEFVLRGFLAGMYGCCCVVCVGCVLRRSTGESGSAVRSMTVESGVVVHERGSVDCVCGGRSRTCDWDGLLELLLPAMGKPRLSMVARAREVMPRGLRILSNIEPGAAGRLLVVEEARVTWTSISSSSLIDTSPSSVASDIFPLVNRCVRRRRNSVSTQ